MMDIKTNRKGQKYRIPADIILSLNQDTLILQSEYVSVWKTVEVGTEFELTISEFDKAISKISENSNFSHIVRISKISRG